MRQDLLFLQDLCSSTADPAGEQESPSNRTAEPSKEPENDYDDPLELDFFSQEALQRWILLCCQVAPQFLQSCTDDFVLWQILMSIFSTPLYGYHGKEQESLLVHLIKQAKR